MNIHLGVLLSAIPAMIQDAGAGEVLGTLPADVVVERPIWLLPFLASLLLASGFFSSSETALFSLSRDQHRRSSRTVQRLLERPQALLVTILLCNLLVNVMFFAFARRLVAPSEGGLREVLVALGGLTALLIFGEIVPKTLALRQRMGIARLAAPIIGILVVPFGRLSKPAMRLLELPHGLLDRRLAPDRGLTPEALARVLARGAKEGVLEGEEADILAEIVELDEVRVREIMTPRVDALFLNVDGSDRDELVTKAVAARQSWLPVVADSPDQIIGRVRLRELIREPGKSIDSMVMPVRFVPEVASALDLLRTLKEHRAAEAVVVDEWGGTAGYVTAEQVFEEIVGELRTEDEVRVPALVPLGENRYRVAGGLSVRDWNDSFGLRIVPHEFETVGGLVTARLGRIPRVGDEVLVENLHLEVSEVRGRRVLTVDISMVSSEVETEHTGSGHSGEKPGEKPGEGSKS
ncbi:MAG: putative hemolysin [Planctomycetota bacterium]